MLAGAAPRGPKIDQDGYLIAADVFVKCSLVQIGRVGVEQGLFALAAGGRAAQLVGADAVGGVAVGANYMLGFSHVFYLRAEVWISSASHVRLITFALLFLGFLQHRHHLTVAARTGELQRGLALAVGQFQIGSSIYQGFQAGLVPRAAIA